MITRMKKPEPTTEKLNAESVIWSCAGMEVKLGP